MEQDASGAGRGAILLRTLGRIARQPLFHFFVVGLLLFVAASYWQSRASIYRVVIGSERIGQLEARYRAENEASPTAEIMKQLVDNDIDEEVLYREGLARKLDRDDEIVRRRVVQKMRFLMQDLEPPAEPDEGRLRSWYQGHRADYTSPRTVSFSHIFFADGGAGAHSRQRAVAVLARLSDSQVRAPDRGDPFLDLYDYASFGQEQADRLFGKSELSRKLLEVPPRHWVGPFQSIYGWHLVRVQSATPVRMLDFAEARPRVRSDVIAADQKAANVQRFNDLKARFTIVREDQATRP